MNSYTIRQITVQDVPFLWVMLYESLHVREDQKPFDRNVINEPFLSKYVEGWGKAGDVGFIAEDSNGLSIGSITARFFSEENKGFGFVSNNIPELSMAIRTENRGKGIGSTLLKRLIDEMKVKGIKGLSLSVDPGNLPAVTLYKRFGFKEVEMVDTSITMAVYL
jgi:ribosomal protein S18 acetylase RimI-like enzyme